MKLALRWKITLTFTLVMLAVFLLLEVYLRHVAFAAGMQNMAQGLLSETRLAARALPGRPWEPGPALQSLGRELDQRSGARFTLIAANGRVLADSREDPAGMEDHADRPERLQAVGQGWGQAKRHSATLGVDMLYVALALPDTGTPPAVLRLAKPLTAVHAASDSLRHVVLGVFAVAVVILWLVSYLLAGALTAPVQSLVRVARRVDRGDLQARVEDVRGGELGELATVFNAALERLADLVASSQRESRYYAAILEQMGDCVVIVDPAGKVQFVNPAFTRLFPGTETPDPALRGRGLPSPTPTAAQVTLSYDLSALLLRAVEQRAVQRDEVRLVQPEPRVLATAASPLVDEQGQVIGAIGLLRDVTERRRLEEVRREFVANASHELRTPAAGIKALAEALQAGAFRDAEKGPRFVTQIVEAADRLTSILDDMLTLTRVERGQELFSALWLTAAEAAHEAAAQVSPTAQAKAVQLRVDVPDTDRVFADANGLHTILVNLLDNAVKYTPATGTVTVHGRSVPEGYEFAVSDTGLGIPPEHQPRIFERFYRVDKARDRATGGTGLGLAIVKHTVEAHGGRVAVRSVPDEGSTFTVFFPTPPAA